MTTLPSLREIKEIAAEGRYKVAPVTSELLSDVCTPIEAVRILKRASSHVFLLESVTGYEKWGRYTFLGYEPKAEITCADGKIAIDGKASECKNPSAFLRELLSEYYSPRISCLPPFTGGLVGYFSYDYISYSEPSVKVEVEDEENFKDADLMLFDKVIAFDNFRQKIILIVNMPLVDIEKNYAEAVKELEKMKNLLLNGEKTIENGRLAGEVKPLFDKEKYCSMVEEAKRHITEGDIFQIVLSNRLSAPFKGSLLNAYRVLRTINPSPYMFYFSGTDVEVAGLRRKLW